MNNKSEVTSRKDSESTH